MKILTFNRHESFLCSLAATGHDFDVVVGIPGGESLAWAPHARPAPPNVRMLRFDGAVRDHLACGGYDLVIAHTVRDLATLFPYRRANYVFCAHIPLYYHSPRAAAKSLAKRAALFAFGATHELQVVAVSEFKRVAWRLGAGVVPLAPEPMPRLEAELEPGALVVCNDLGARRAELGAGTITALARLVPLTVVGQRNGIPGGFEPRTHAEFLRTIRRFGIFVYTVERPFGDGYNLALLEAMSMGMAIVTVPNPSSPVVHGASGLIGGSVAELAAHVRRLLVDPAERERLGAAARELVRRDFSRRAFIDGWSQCLAPGARTNGWLAPIFVQSV